MTAIQRLPKQIDISPTSTWSSIDEDYLEELAFIEDRSAELAKMYLSQQQQTSTEEKNDHLVSSLDDEVITFDKVEVGPIGVEERKNEVDEIINDDDFSMFGSGVAQALVGGDLYYQEEENSDHDEDGEPLTVYLPNRVPIQLRINIETKVARGIEIALKKVATLIDKGEDLGRGADALGRGTEAAECYDLLLHDEDGEPDEDSPALERSRPILGFGTDELCLVEKPDAPVIKPDDRDSSCEKISFAQKSSGNTIQVYFPDASKISVFLKSGTHVNTFAKQALLQSKKYRHITKFEIRLHDTDGKPDYDLPALDPAQTDLGQLDEICLIFDDKESAKPPLRRGTNSTASLKRRQTSIFRGSSGGSSLHLLSTSSSSPEIMNMQQHRGSKVNSINAQLSLKVHCLYDDDIIQVKADASWTMSEVRALILRRKKMNRWPIDYGLRMSEADRERLGLPEEYIDDHLTIADLHMAEIFSLELYNREWKCGNYWIDAKPVPGPELIADKRKKNAQKSAPNTDKNFISPADFHFNPATGPAYEQWNVVKINEFGRRQERIFGVDGLHLYNTKREAKNPLGGCKKISSTYRPSRKISDILKTNILEINGRRNTIQIVYLEHNKHVSRKYELDTEYDAAHIVAKIRYNRRLLADAARR
mmetsp:Transcript_1580/g.2401  ORF Transcript_1580/g.2401 Transcript_1580/m.2401 type:complete len:650 (-) Transcript_1580:272-2221(-)